MRKATRPLFLAVVASAMLLPVFAQHEPIRERDAIQIRALVRAATSAAASAAPTTAPQSSSTPAQTTTTTTAQNPATTQEAASSSSPATTPAAPTSSQSQPAQTTAHATSAQSSSAQPQGVTTTAIPTTATDAQGQVITSFILSTAALPSATPSRPDAQSSSGGGGLNTGSIIGLSVAGGIAALGIVLFFVWKFTRKRFSDFDDSEAIKWPELNTHNNDVHALPTNSTGRAGFGPENDSDINLVRPPSPGGAYANSIAASSVPEMYGSGDPYAVPPLPHLNPNQPYHDEPGTHGQPGGYYDPYRGPVPNTFTDTTSDGHGAEAFQMTQMARMRSPAPQVAYDMQGRGSPAPQAAMGYPGVDERSRTPNPGALGTGRASPGPHSGYGYGPR